MAHHESTWEPKAPRKLQIVIEDDLVRRLKSLAALKNVTTSQMANDVLKLALNWVEADTTKGRNGAQAWNE